MTTVVKKTISVPKHYLTSSHKATHKGFFFLLLLAEVAAGEKQSFQLYVDVTYAVLVLTIQGFNYQHFVLLPPKGDFILNILQHKFVNTEKYPTVT